MKDKWSQTLLNYYIFLQDKTVLYAVAVVSGLHDWFICNIYYKATHATHKN